MMRFNTVTFVMLCLCCSCAFQGFSRQVDKKADLKTIKVKTNKNIELFGLMMQLNLGADLIENNDSVMIDNKMSSWKDWYRLTLKNYLRYRPFSDSRMMRLYQSLAQKGFYDDFFIGFLLQVDEVPMAKLKGDTDREVIAAFSKDGNYAAAEKEATEFLDHLNEFYTQVNFAKYLAENDLYYQTIVADVRKNLPPESFVPAIEAFYQKGFEAYYLVPALNIPTSMGFGKMNKATRAIYNVFGPFSFQNFDPSDLRLGFDDRLQIERLSVHEFGHSFVNPVVDRLPDELLTKTEHLFTPIKEQMSNLAYPNWKICLYEHFVKAGEVILAEKLGRTGDAEQMVRDAHKAGFIYLRPIVAELKKYDKNKKSGSYENYIQQVMFRLASL